MRNRVYLLAVFQPKVKKAQEVQCLNNLTQLKAKKANSVNVENNNSGISLLKKYHSI